MSQPDAAPAPMLERDGRIVAIDILRGLAILWVVLFHLWEDVKVVQGVPADYFSALTAALRAGDLDTLPTAIIDAVLRVGYQGVPVFMMLSGLSLYLSTARQGDAVDWPRFMSARFRRILIPYWFGFGVILAAVVALAAVQAVWFGTSFHHEYWNGITISRIIPVRIDAETGLASLLLVPRMLQDQWLFVPNSSLWFVVLIVQYYAMFPFLKAFLDRFGPWWLLAVSLVATIGGKLTLIAIAGDIAAPEAFRVNFTLAPLRVFEFALGMALGYLMVHRREILREYLTAPADVAGIVFIGLLLQVGGSVLDARTHYLAALSIPMIIAGLTLICAPLITRAPGRIERSSPMRLMAWIGIMSYAVLITNEPLRLVSSSLQVHGAADGWWYAFLVLYLPATLLTARPVARLLGLVPGSRGEAAGREPQTITAAIGAAP